MTISRSLWAVAVLTAVVLFAVQVISRFDDYFSYPSTVNVDVVYVDEIEFPAVTLCNQNSFRSALNINKPQQRYNDSDKCNLIFIYK